MKLIYQWIITTCFVLFSISVGGTIQAMAADYPEDAVPSRDKTSGYDSRDADKIIWNYDETTKTLSFTGEGTMEERDDYFEEEDYDYFDNWYNAGLKEGNTTMTGRILLRQRLLPFRRGLPALAPWHVWV